MTVNVMSLRSITGGWEEHRFMVYHPIVNLVFHGIGLEMNPSGIEALKLCQDFKQAITRCFDHQNTHLNHPSPAMISIIPHAGVLGGKELHRRIFQRLQGTRSCVG